MIPPSIISRGVGWQVRIQILYCGWLSDLSLYHGVGNIVKCETSLPGHWSLAWFIFWDSQRDISFGVSIIRVKKIKCQSLFVQNKNVLLICIMIFCAYRENIGLLGLTRIGSRRVVQISAGFMIFFSVLGNLLYWLLLDIAMQFSVSLMWWSVDGICFAKPGKFGALFASIPLPIFAGMYCLFFAYVGKSISLKKCYRCLTVSTW